MTGGQTRSHIFFENSDSGSVPAVTRLPSQRLSNGVPVRFEDALLVRRSFDTLTTFAAQDDILACGLSKGFLHFGFAFSRNDSLYADAARFRGVPPMAAT